MTLNINCDMGESFGHFRMGNDEALFPYIHSCNIACGFHGGDPFHIENTIKNAIKYQLIIGAHPSYPDLAGFGRRPMQLPKEELTAILKYQIAALKGMAESLGGRLSYVKPHGALYNRAAQDETETLTIIEAIRAIDPNLALMGLAGSCSEKVAKEQHIPYIAEAFGDRTYLDNGQLMLRNQPGAVIENPAIAVRQILQIAREHRVKTASGKALAIQAQSICIHGDNPAALAILQALQEETSTQTGDFSK